MVIKNKNCSFYNNLYLKLKLGFKIAEIEVLESLDSKNFLVHQHGGGPLESQSVSPSNMKLLATALPILGTISFDG